jgi:two-component system, NarL family, response regulator LiaR
MSFPVIVIDDHELFATSLVMALRGHGFDARQVPVARLAEDLASPSARRPGLVVLDLNLGRDPAGRWLSGVDLMRTLRRHGWKVLVVSGSVDTPGVAAAINEGAIGSVPKSSSFQALLDTVVAAAAGEPVMSAVDRARWLARHRGYQAQERELARRLGRLSTREREVLELLAEGHRAAEIADRFTVSLTTVRTQIRSVLSKLEVGSQLEAVALIRQMPSG